MIIVFFKFLIIFRITEKSILLGNGPSGRQRAFWLSDHVSRMSERQDRVQLGAPNVRLHWIRHRILQMRFRVEESDPDTVQDARTTHQQV